MQFILSPFKNRYFRSGGEGEFSLVLLPVVLGVTDPLSVVTRQLGCHLHGLGWQLLTGGRANTLCSRRGKKHLSVVFAYLSQCLSTADVFRKLRKLPGREEV